MKNLPLVSVIIPAYNELDRIFPIIKVVQASGVAGEIIVVDDGSDSTSKIILKKIDGIKLITHPQNFGKSRALKTGVLAAKGDILAFIDADLTNLKPIHLLQLITPVQTGQADIVLSERDQEYFKIFDSGFVVAYTGERCFKKQLLMDNLDIFDVDGYLVEPSFNRRFLASGLTIARVRFWGVSHCPKFVKTVLLKGLFNDFRMSYKIFKYLGPRQLLRQTSICRHLPYLS